MKKVTLTLLFLATFSYLYSNQTNKDMPKIKHFNETHGESLKSKEYGTWARILRRCYNPNDSRYYSHGARGITVCDRWRHSYENFLSDMGRAPSKNHSIDRKENNGNYEPGNCRWATVEEQANNKRRTVYVDYNGVKRPLGLLCYELGLPIELIRGRINLGWTIEKAISTPKLSKINFYNKRHVVKKSGRHCGFI